MALAGTIIGAATMAFIGEPERGRYLDEETKRKELEKKEEEAKAALERNQNPVAAFFENISVVFKLPTAKNVLIASSLRNFGGMIIAAYLPVFFGKNFPTFKAEYALLNAILVSMCGLIASLSGGIIADKFESKSYMTKAMICAVGCLLSFPLVAIGTLQTSNFYLALICYGLKVLVSGTYSGPAITMIQNTSPLNQQGNVISVYFFCITIAQTIGPFVFNIIANWYGCFTNPAMYGPLITAAIGVSYLGSIPFWWKAGKEYTKYMKAKDAQEALEAQATTDTQTA
jgi:MFS family permease